MDVTSITIDEFFQLDISHHKEAIRAFDLVINKLIEELAAHADKETSEYDTQRDRLCTLLTVRKVHEARLLELISDAENADSHPSQQTA